MQDTDSIKSILKSETELIISIEQMLDAICFDLADGSMKIAEPNFEGSIHRQIKSNHDELTRIASCCMQIRRVLFETKTEEKRGLSNG